ELGWKSPVTQPVNPAFVNAAERGGLGWLSGFNEWMCRCGLDSNGPPGADVVLNNQGHPTKTEMTLHGKTANIPAHYVEVSADSDGRTQALLRNAHGDKGISLRYLKAQLPCFTVWKNTQAEADGYVTGLEPGTNYPNLKTFEREKGRVVKLAPGASYVARLEI